MTRPEWTEAAVLATRLLPFPPRLPTRQISTIACQLMPLLARTSDFNLFYNWTISCSVAQRRSRPFFSYPPVVVFAAILLDSFGSSPAYGFDSQ
jgi:hypothetical protein